MQFSFSSLHLLTKEVVREIYCPVLKSVSKNNNGEGMLVAGSRNMPGAALLSAKAALRSGVGKIIVHAPTTVLDKVILAIPEAILDADKSSNCFSTLPNNLDNCNALAIGPGLGRNKSSALALLELLKSVSYPIIIDADALNIIAENKEWFDFIPHNSILTPHSGEFDRLFGKSANRFERIIKSQDISVRFGVNIILKGQYSTITTFDGKIYVNTTGNQGMATAGSGDVLTGTLLGILSKGYPPTRAAQLGVFMHGLAGDCALKKQSFETLIASDIVESLGEAFKSISKIQPTVSLPIPYPSDMLLRTTQHRSQ